MPNPKQARRSARLPHMETVGDAFAARLRRLGAADDVCEAARHDPENPAIGWTDRALRAELAAIEADAAYHEVG